MKELIPRRKGERRVRDLPPEYRRLLFLRQKEQKVETALHATVVQSINWSTTPERLEFWLSVAVDKELPEIPQSSLDEINQKKLKFKLNF